MTATLLYTLHLILARLTRARRLSVYKLRETNFNYNGDVNPGFLMTSCSLAKLEMIRDMLWERTVYVCVALIRPV